MIAQHETAGTMTSDRALSHHRRQERKQTREAARARRKEREDGRSQSTKCSEASQANQANQDQGLGGSCRATQLGWSRAHGSTIRNPPQPRVHNPVGLALLRDEGVVTAQGPDPGHPKGGSREEEGEPLAGSRPGGPRAVGETEWRVKPTESTVGVAQKGGKGRRPVNPNATDPEPRVPRAPGLPTVSPPHPLVSAPLGIGARRAEGWQSAGWSPAPLLPHDSFPLGHYPPISCSPLIPAPLRPVRDRPGLHCTGRDADRLGLLRLWVRSQESQGLDRTEPNPQQKQNLENTSGMGALRSFAAWRPVSSRRVTSPPPEFRLFAPFKISCFGGGAPMAAFNGATSGVCVGATWKLCVDPTHVVQLGPLTGPYSVLCTRSPS
ncbi:uncharacterized protein N7482_006008 [Penicillium canariense]|uniref:Uncharacterized protein n=1 Tax=Penicillium canariense TaxID=189055 RepID=A0A9W9I7J6_9EURO|nr:uncharacterized protein N7482_006008 [Penicillium canariense]KAJ5167227.1 hypothetical protein N7482_006008 [Penicillium canariense]